MGDGVSIQTKRALIESGAYAPEDLGMVRRPQPKVQPTWAVGGSSAAADQRAVSGETPLQQRQRQDAQLKALLEARKRKGYAGGGAIKGALNRLAQAKLGPQRGLNVVRDFALDIPGPAVAGKSFEHEDFGALVDLLAPYGRAKALPPDHASIFEELIHTANHEAYPDAITRVTMDAAGKPQAAYQVMPAADEAIDPDYLAYLVSLNGDKGAGTQAVEHAKQSSPGRVRTFPAPSAKGFWDKTAERQEGWRVEPGGAVDVDSLMWEKPKGYAGGGAVLGGLGRLAKHLSGDAPVRRGVADVIKERGGQWLSGAYSPEEALKPLRKMPFGEEPEQRLRDLAKWEARENNPETLRAIGIARATQTRNAALNSFVDKQLTKYVKRDLATEGDPIRKLAEQDILHARPQDIYDADVADLAEMSRSKARKRGFPSAGPRGVSEEAAAWDSAADASLHVNKAGTLAKDANAVDIDSWLPKVDQETPVYEPSADPRQGYSLGFEHLMDELGNAINPKSGLPPQLQITPEQIMSGNFSMEAAVRRVAEINAWREAQKVEASKALANNAATHLHKDYPDKGFKWVELKAPEASLGEYPTPEAFYKANGKAYDQDTLAALKDALKYEGDTMGHCVGGYCDDVASGRSRIYSLRDAKGQPHVTIETSPQPYEGFDPQGDWDKLPEELQDALMKDHGAGNVGWTSKIKQDPRVVAWEAENIPRTPDRVVQIKGKGNKKPIADYIPFVQDFVKSGQWSDVRDFNNTDLEDLHNYQDTVRESAKAAGLGRYVTREELQPHVDAEFLQKFSNKFASGGLIGLNPRKPLELTVTPNDVMYGSGVDEKSAAADDQAYNESRRRMFAARQREDAAANRLSTIDRILARFPSSTYTPPVEFSESKAAPAFGSFEEAVEAGGDLRLGLGQLLASPLMVTDIAEAGLDKLRGVQSPNRFRQVSNAISKALGGPEEPEVRLEGSHDMQFLAASLANPVNFLPAGKLGAVAKKLPRFAKGGEVDLYKLHGYN